MHRYYISYKITTFDDLGMLNTYFHDNTGVRSVLYSTPKSEYIVKEIFITMLNLEIASVRDIRGQLKVGWNVIDLILNGLLVRGLGVCDHMYG